LYYFEGIIFMSNGSVYIKYNDHT